MKYQNNFFQLKAIPMLIAILIIGLQSFNLSAQNNRARYHKKKLGKTIERKIGEQEIIIQGKIVGGEANNLFQFSEFNKALPVYLNLLKDDSTNFLLNYRIGICYLNSNLQTLKAVKHFEVANDNMKTSLDSTAEFFYYLGHAFQISNQFDKAIRHLSKAKSLLEQNGNSYVKTYLKKGAVAAEGDNYVTINDISYEIEQCENGKNVISSRTNAIFFNLDTIINSIYPDYSPIILPDQSKLIFTSTRKGSKGGKLTQQGEYFEDIYSSTNNINDTLKYKIESPLYYPNYSGVNFSVATNVGYPINTKAHDAAISVSPDGKYLYLFRRNAVSYAEIKNKKFGHPSKYNFTVNGIQRYETSFFITDDEQTLYFVSDQKGGIGGKDIYKSLIQKDGTWGPEENLGPTINTEQDEEAPYFDSNEGMLYFSSQGHNSIGGYDVFKTEVANRSAPENLGYPINSGSDDIFYSYNSKTNRGFVTTMREGGVGNYDIYMIRYITPLKVLFNTTYANGLKPIEVKAAKIISLESNALPLNVSLNKTSDISYNTKQKYKLTVPRYDDVSKSDTFNFATPESYNDFSYYQEINYDKVLNNRRQIIGYKTTVYNAFFDIEKEDIEYKKLNDAFLHIPLNQKEYLNEQFKNRKKEIGYSLVVKKLKSKNQFFQIHSKINYIDTTTLAIVNEIKDVEKSIMEQIKEISNTPISEPEVETKKAKAPAKELSEPTASKNNANTPKKKEEKKEVKEEKKLPANNIKSSSGKIVFKVQILALSKPKSKEEVAKLFKIKDPNEIETVTTDGITRYTLGLYNSHKDAEEHKEMFASKGYKGISVVAFKDGKQISIKEAGVTH